MRNHRTIWLLATLLALVLLPDRIYAADQASPIDALIAGENAFALDLYSQLKSLDGNLFFSPYSISTCLGMTYAGARGTTAREMAQTLHFNAGPTQLAIPMGQLRKDLNKIGQEKGIELNTANGLWAQAGDAFLPAFLEIAQQQFGATINQADFRKHAEPTRKEINGWVSQQTKNKINDLIAPGMLTPATSLVLVNAIFFKGKWVHQFNKTNTADAPFTLESGQKAQAKMMHVETGFDYAETEDLQLLKMDYVTGKQTISPAEAEEWAPLFDRISMVVLLPKEVNGLKKLEKQLNGGALDNWLSQAHPEKVKVFFPKFKMTSEFNLSQTLARMGMPMAFTPQADFSGMNGKRDLFISDVVHKAFVDVNEEGTEAAAATGVVHMRGVAMRPRPTPVFRADHPFIFLIRDNFSGAILFLGRVNDATK